MATERIIIQFRADGTRVVQRDIKKIGDRAKKAGTSAQFLKRALTFVGIAAAVRGLTRTLAGFEQTMSTVRAITEATDDQFASLRDRAKELGATTRFSAAQAGEGLVELSRAGFLVVEAIETVDDTLRLAQAGNLDLATAAKITAGAIRGFRVEVDQAGRFVDVLALTANSSATDVTELGEAMKFVAPAAASLKVPFETAAAALGVLADNQLRGTLGGTGLRKVLSTLAKGGKPLVAALKASGQTLADVDVQTVGLTKALGALEKANISTGDAFKIFGDRGQPAFDVLVNNIPKLAEFDLKLQDAAGTAQRIADVMDDNLNGALLQVKSAFEAVILAVGELGATSILTKLFRQLADVLRFVAANIEKVAKVAIGALFIPAVLAAIAVVKSLTLALLANPFTLFITVLSTITALLVSFRNEIKVSGDGITTLGDIAVPVFDAIKRGIQAVTDFIFGTVPAAGKEMEDAFTPTFIETFVRGVAKSIDFILGLAQAASNAIIFIYDNFGAVVEIGFKRSVNTVIDLINTMVRFFVRQLDFITLQLNEVAIRFGKSFSFTAPQIPNIKLPENAERIGGELNAIIARGFSDRTAFTDAVDRIFLEGIDNARDRIEALEATARASAKRAFGLLDELQERFRSGPQAPDPATGAAPAAAPEVPTPTDPGTDLAAETQKNAILSARKSILGDIMASQIERTANTEALNSLLAEEKITQEQFNQLVEELPTNIEKSSTAMDGFAESIKRVDTSAKALGNSIGNLVVGAIGSASDALAEFAVTGFQNTEDLKKAFSDLLRQLAKDVIKLIIQTLILKAIQAGLGGGAAPTRAGGPIGQLRTFQAGGSPASREPVLVGEGGPEIFVPTRRGNVIPNSQVPAPVVNVQVVNVRDPDEIPEALDTPEAEEQILNIIRKNPRVIV